MGMGLKQLSKLGLIFSYTRAINQEGISSKGVLSRRGSAFLKVPRVQALCRNFIEITYIQFVIFTPYLYIYSAEVLTSFPTHY